MTSNLSGRTAFLVMALALAAAGSVAIDGQTRVRDAWAPKYVTTTTALSDVKGSTADAYFTATGEPTIIMRWPSSGSGPINGVWPAVGTPCSTYPLPVGATSGHAIAGSTSRRCL